MKNIFAIIILGLLTGCVTTDLYTPPEDSSESPNYANAKLVNEQQIIITGINHFNGQSLKKIFPFLI